MYVLNRENGQSAEFDTLGMLLHYLNEKVDGRPLIDRSRLREMSVIDRGNPDETMPLTQRMNHIGVQLPGDAMSWIDIMIREALSYARTADGSVKTPQQMTVSEWGGVVAIGSVAYGVVECFTREQAATRLTSPRTPGLSVGLVDYMHQKVREAFGYGHNGPTLPDGGVNSRHDVHVAYALARNEALPLAVTAEYAENELFCSFDLGWGREFLDKPWLRGQISVDKLRMLLSLAKTARCRFEAITPENFAALRQALSGLPDRDPSYIEAEDALYDAGWIEDRPFTPGEDVSSAHGHTLLAMVIRTHLVQMQVQQQTARMHKDRAEGRMSKAEVKYHTAVIADIARTYTWTGAEGMAAAIERKDIDLLISALDTPDDWNVATKRAIAETMGVKLLGLRAAARRKAVFAVIGATEDAEIERLEAEIRQRRDEKKAQRAKKLEETAVERTREAAQRKRYRLEDGSVVNGAELIDRCVAQGANSIAEYPQGAARRYFLRHGSTLWPLGVKDGTLAYARAVLERLRQQQKSVALAA